ncbi:MAG: hypothetical protein HY834_20765 [Devosia nanyangense]|uniref:Uncharacterized protein n=1 Tax=Devosia nanyangense TaxID=1228055 RepID=A0A933L890_9HYPH|nr:hypothetical protein [Devosia nanyangense]
MTEEYPHVGDVMARLGVIAATPREAARSSSLRLVPELLQLSETILETWLSAHGAEPTVRQKEGFRLLALHAQAARGEPSFNACRETCREIVFQNNVVSAAGDEDQRERAFRLMIMVVRHLALFVSGKLEVAGLGEFCCASRPLRQPAAEAAATTQPSGV